MRKLKIANIITKLELGGAQLCVLNIIKNLDRNLFSVYLITAKDGMLNEEAKQIPNTKIYFVPSLKRSIDPINDFKSLFQIYDFIRKNKFDIVHTHSSKAGILGRWAAYFAGTPIIIHTIHGFGFHPKQFCILKRLFIILEKITAKITTKLLAVCQSDIKKGLSYKIGSENQYAIIHYGIEKEKFLSLPKKKISAQAHPVIATVSCLKPQKAPLTYIQACKIIKQEFPQARFWLIGDGVLRKKASGFLREYKLEKNFKLWGWQRDILSILAEVDIFVLSSLWEGLPMAIIEALSAAKPVVATAVDGIPEVIRDKENGFLVKPDDHQALAEKIIYLLKNENLATDIGANNRQAMEKTNLFTIKDMVDKLQFFYLQVGSNMIKNAVQ